MATKKKEETPVADGQPLQEENQAIATSDMEAAPEQAPEIPQTSEEAGNTRVGAETSEPSDAEAENTRVTKTPDDGGNEPVEKPAGPKMESLSVLADRHRIPAWHQAALLRYMGWQDDKMVTDEDYRKALDELKHRRIGGGRK